MNERQYTIISVDLEKILLSYNIIDDHKQYDFIPTDYKNSKNKMLYCLMTHKYDIFVIVLKLGMDYFRIVYIHRYMTDR